MKYYLVVLFVCFSAFVNAQSEISLFNSEGEATAYIDTEDGTIYLWEGKPVAYLHKKNGTFHIYGFNGEHLGWFVDGIVRDHEGNAVGVTEKATNMYTGYEPYKGYKEPKPYKDYREYAPYKPYFSNSWSSINFSLFLIQGISQ
jgi:hypothetical protein